MYKKMIWWENNPGRGVLKKEKQAEGVEVL